MNVLEFIDLAKALPLPIARWSKRIAGAALGNDVDPVVLAAIMAQESSGEPSVVGFDKHGHGLMQVDDRAHPTFAAACWGRTKARLVYRPGMNLEYAAELMADNLAIFKGDLWPAVAAFNAGPGKVSAAIARLGTGASAAERFAAANSVTHKGEYLTRVKGYFERFTAALMAAQRKGGGNV